MKNDNLVDLKTSDACLPSIPLSEYPRPQMVRDSYLCLNGKWDFALTASNLIPDVFDKSIIVPYCVESLLSGVKERVNENDFLYYKKQFSLPKGFNKGRVLLHIDGCDCYCDIYLNGNKIGHNEGGYIPFEFDITKDLQEENILTIQVTDPLDHVYPYGKQKVNRGGMWYTPVSGIWKSVWLESVPEEYIQSIKIDTTLNSLNVKVNSSCKEKKIIIHLENEDIEKEFNNDEIEIALPSCKPWSPESPTLYAFDVIAGQDKISSYFGLRTIQIKQVGKFKRFLLNGKPYFFHGLLDQGYYPDGIYTPSSYKEYENDITRMKGLGFNTLRKHIKVEPLYFYYLCDKIGMVVFQDIVNNSDYHFFRDTALPTIGLQNLNDNLFYVPSKNKKVFEDQMKKEVSLLYNTPSICLWTIFNEGWGQFESSLMTKKLISIDRTRLIDSCSGWFRNSNELDSKHIYFKKVNMTYKDKPLYLSEFGGYACAIKDHVFNIGKAYGYKIYQNIDDLQKGITSLYEDEIIPLINKQGLNASIYTQVSDVEDEINGLLTYDRKVCKVNQKEMQRIAELLTII